MRLLYFHRGYFPLLAGAEAMTYLVAEAMERRGHQVKIVCQSSTETFEQQEINNIEIIKVPTLATETLGMFLNWSPDIIHAVDAVWPEYPQAALDLARAKQANFVITPASTMSVWHNLAATLAVCQQASTIFVLTKAEKTRFIDQGLAADRLVIIGQGSHLVGKADPAGFRKRYDISGPMILFLGRKAHFKGYKQLLAATAEVWSRFPQAHFVFIGPRWDPDCLEVFAAYDDPRIVEIGMVDEPEKHSALTACDLFCLPSSADVFPLVYIEAWSCGKPVIASHFPGIEEIVHHGQDGLIVESSSSAIAAAILQMLEDTEKCHTFGITGLARVRQEFNWEVVADRIEATYINLVKAQKN